MSMASMEKHLFNLKFAAKELERNSKKCDKEEKVEKAGLKKAIEKGNMEASDSIIVLISSATHLYPRLPRSMLRMLSGRRTSLSTT